MPHVIIKMKAGRSEEQKHALTAAVVADIVTHTGAPESAVSVAIEDYDGDDWPEAVYRPDILEYEGDLRKAPGYPNPFEG